VDKKPISPLESVLVTCPACGKGYLEQRLSPQAYRVTASDTDFCPAERIWLHPQTNGLTPLAYFMQTCPNCYFTTESRDALFHSKPHLVEKDPQLTIQIQRHQEQLEMPDSPLSKLAQAYRRCHHSFCRVVLKFLLGICDEKLKDHYSNYNLARYYLRLAWVFRERTQLENPEAGLRLLEIKDKLNKQSEEHRKYLGEVEQLSELLDRDFLTLSGPEGDQKEGYSYQDILDSLQSNSTGTKKREASSEREPDFLPGNVNLSTFLLELRSVWTGVPLNETEALKFALSYYHQYFQTLPQKAYSSSQVQTAYLIGELFRRTGEYSQSQKFFSLAISIGEKCLRQEKETYRSAFAQKIIVLATRQQNLAERQQLGQAI
jgi:uncharacterized protein (DUF2225 family)